MNKKRISADSVAFPPAIRPYVENAALYDSSCSGDAAVYFSDRGYYIKTASPGRLSREAVMARFFHRLGLGPEVLAYETGDRDFLVTRSAGGEDMTHLCHDPVKLCTCLAAALKKLHAQNVEGVILSSLQQRYLESAAGEITGGCREEYVCLNRFPVPSREEAWEIMQKNKHRLKWDTLIHGDACLPNVICDRGEFLCFIDCALAGRGDRHIDLYWAVWSLEYNLGTDRYTELFLELYGRENYDPDMLRVIAAFEVFG